MKIIALLPVKNEGWIIGGMISNIALWADNIIVADQNSTDDTLEILRAHPKVTVINNPEIVHSNKVRWLLLDKAREISGNNLIVSIDTDEALPPKLFIEEIKNMKLQPGTAIEAHWIQLWGKVSEYNNTGVWKNNKKIFGFLDDRKMDYDRVFIINDHTSRVPVFNKNRLRTLNTPLLHFQFVAWERTQWKQAWYRCHELMLNHSTLSSRKINAKYSSTLPLTNPKLETTKLSWLSDLIIPENLINGNFESWHRDEIVKMFNKHGILFFEPLQIWHIPELRNIFIKQIGREPESSLFPSWVIYLNSLKNKLRSCLREL